MNKLPPTFGIRDQRSTHSWWNPVQLSIKDHRSTPSINTMHSMVNQELEIRDQRSTYGSSTSSCSCCAARGSPWAATSLRATSPSEIDQSETRRKWMNDSLSRLIHLINFSLFPSFLHSLTLHGTRISRMHNDEFVSSFHILSCRSEWREESERACGVKRQDTSLNFPFPHPLPNAIEAEFTIEIFPYYLIEWRSK